MNKFSDIARTLFSFFNQFGVKAYPQNGVPEGTPFPYITYSVEEQDNWESGILQVLVYSKSNSYTEVTTIADKIMDQVSSGIKVPIANSGMFYMTKGSPFCQLINATDEVYNKSVLINIEYKNY